MKRFLVVITYVAAILLAGIAAYYSIFGLGKLFASQATAVMIMAGILEASKLITASILHKFWTKIQVSLKIYLTSAVIILMMITSLGIYGFLVSSYQETSSIVQTNQVKIEMIESNIENVNSNIDQNNNQIDSKLSRIEVLTNQRSSQESRLDTLYNRGWINNAKRVESYIQTVDQQINDLQTESDEIQSRINIARDSLVVLSTEKINLENNDAAAELGPLMYIADITGIDIDIVVNWFILFFILVFDPLAVTLLITAQKISTNEKTTQRIINDPIKTTPESDIEVVEENQDEKSDDAIQELSKWATDQKSKKDITPKVIS